MKVKNQRRVMALSVIGVLVVAGAISAALGGGKGSPECVSHPVPVNGLFVAVDDKYGEWYAASDSSTPVGYERNAPDAASTGNDPTGPMFDTVDCALAAQG